MSRRMEKRTAKVSNVVAAFVEARVRLMSIHSLHSDGRIHLTTLAYKEAPYTEEEVKAFAERVAIVADDPTSIFWDINMVTALNMFIESRQITETVSSQMVQAAVEAKRNEVLVSAYRNGWDSEPEFVAVMEAETVKELERLSRTVSKDAAFNKIVS